MASLKDYYDILGIQRGATEEEVEKAYRKLARAYQVDSPHSGSRAAEIRFREIAEAYAVLSDKEKRAKYDQAGVNFLDGDTDRDFDWEEEPEVCNFEGFEEFFAETYEKGEVSFKQPQKGRELHYHLCIPFEHALRGIETQIEVEDEIPCPECLGQGFDPRGPLENCRECGGAGQIQVGLFPDVFAQKCRHCQGWGRIRRKICPMCEGAKRGVKKKHVSLSIPSGVSNGCRIYLKGGGTRGRNGAPNGDLLVTLEIQKHPYFRKDGEDIYLEVPLTVWEAALGTRVKVPTLEGNLWARVAPGTQNGAELRLQGRGVPSLHGKTKGNQVLVFRVVIPQDLDSRSVELLRELKRRTSFNPRKKSGWAGRF